MWRGMKGRCTEDNSIKTQPQTEQVIPLRINTLSEHTVNILKVRSDLHMEEYNTV